MTCPDCHGTGVDDNKTQQARQSGEIDKYATVRCWTCVGNGIVEGEPVES